LAEDRFEKVRHDLEDARRKVTALEGRLETVGREASATSMELKDVKVELAKTRERLELEHATRLKAESAVDNMKRSLDEWRAQADMAAGSRDAVEDK